MRLARTMASILAGLATLLGGVNRSAAQPPVGLQAITGFDLVPQLRQGVRTYQYSSHDPTGYNDDRNHFLQQTGNEQVLLDVTGPGCVYRIWFVGHDSNGHIRLYFDGSSTPLVDMVLSDFFSGTHAPFLAPLVGNQAVSSGGYYCYLPMPFREGCKIITTCANYQYYYHNITFQKLADATGITTFTGQEDSSAARTMWNNAGADPKSDHGSTAISNTVSLPIGSSVTLADIQSPGIIQEVEISIPSLAWDPPVVVTDDGRAFVGSCQFRVAVNPSNQGVKLKRRLDYGIGGQQATVWVDGAQVGTWFTPSGPPPVWLDSTFDIPQTFSAGKSTLNIRIQFVTSQVDWNEFYYWVYSKVGSDSVLTDTLDVGNTTSESNHAYQITNQNWSGTNTLTYYAQATEQQKAMLSGLRLRAYWDGAAEAAIDVPLGDFFGSGLGPYSVRALPVGIDGVRLYCYFPMPFRNAALVQLINSGGLAVNNVSYAIRYTPLAAPLEGVGAFHAKFLPRTPTITGRDYIVLEEAGAGHFVGLVHTMYGPNSFRGYLEGDERIYVDGNLTPSLYGTGTEDFYNGAYYFAHGPFTLPVHGNPGHEPGGRDATTCYRFFLSDLIPFHTSIRVGMEHGGWNDTLPDMQSVAFYYKAAQPLAELTDELDVGEQASETHHGYTATGITWSGTTSGTYEGDDDTVSITDDGQRLTGESRFAIALNPENDGVLLRRRMDYSLPRQQAWVYVDGSLAGTWYEPGQNSIHVFRDAEFLIPSALTGARSVVVICLVNTSGESHWTAYHYWAYTLLPVTPGPALPVASNPEPPDTATGVDSAIVLTWTAHPQALGHDIYFGTDLLAVAQADHSSPEFVGSVPVGSESFDPPGLLTPGTGYYWRIDAQRPAAPPVKGALWRFTTYITPGDFDRDTDVDQADFGHLQACLSGLGYPYSPGCEDADLDGDNSVDTGDVSIFRACMGGANQPPGC